MNLFDEEQIMKSYVRSERREAERKADRATAKRMIKKGKMSLEDVADCVPSLSMDELREIEAEVCEPV